jgi:hypothetical protein
MRLGELEGRLEELVFCKNSSIDFHLVRRESMGESLRESSRGEDKAKTLLQSELVFIVIKHSLIHMSNFSCI